MGGGGRGFILILPVSTRNLASIIPVCAPLRADELRLEKCVRSSVADMEFHVSGEPVMGFNARAFHLAKAMQCHAFGKEYACHTIIVTGKNATPLTLKEAQLLQRYANQDDWKTIKGR